MCDSLCCATRYANNVEKKAAVEEWILSPHFSQAAHIVVQRGFSSVPDPFFHSASSAFCISHIASRNTLHFSLQLKDNNNMQK